MIPNLFVILDFHYARKNLKYIHDIYVSLFTVYKFAFNSKCEGILSENSWKYKLHINRVFFLLENNDLILSKNCNNNKWHYKSMQGQKFRQDTHLGCLSSFK